MGLSEIEQLKKIVNFWTKLKKGLSLKNLFEKELSNSVFY